MFDVTVRVKPSVSVGDSASIRVRVKATIAWL